MHFAFTPDQEALRTEARRWLDERYPPERVAELADSETGWDPASWAEHHSRVLSARLRCNKALPSSD